MVRSQDLRSRRCLYGLERITAVARCCPGGSDRRGLWVCSGEGQILGSVATAYRVHPVHLKALD